MSKDNIVSLLNGFTVELNPKVRHKLNSIPLDKKNNVYITYLPDATEKDILETVEFVSNQNLVPITHLPARTMKDLEHVSSFLKELRKRTDSKKILVIGGGGNQNGSISSSLEILESGLLKENDFTETFIKLSRDVHFLNDDRAKIKLEINNHTGSKIKEIKEYTSY